MLTDTSIESITILYKPEIKGYARQNELIPPNWISIHFGGDVPIIINGRITNLEEFLSEVEAERIWMIHVLCNKKFINPSNDWKSILT